MDSTDRFDALVQAFLDTPGVTGPDASVGSRFGSSALKASGSIFAMLTRGALVVKLPETESPPASPTAPGRRSTLARARR